MIKEILDNLGSEERRKLIYAFDNGFGQYVELPDNKFVGVNIKSIANLKITEQVGCWSCGRINKNL